MADTSFLKISTYQIINNGIVLDSHLLPIRAFRWLCFVPILCVWETDSQYFYFLSAPRLLCGEVLRPLKVKVESAFSGALAIVALYKRQKARILGEKYYVFRLSIFIWSPIQRCLLPLRMVKGPQHGGWGRSEETLQGVEAPFFLNRSGGHLLVGARRMRGGRASLEIVMDFHFLTILRKIKYIMDAYSFQWEFDCFKSCRSVPCFFLVDSYDWFWCAYSIFK